jgi:hypothetical protein
MREVEAHVPTLIHDSLRLITASNSTTSPAVAILAEPNPFHWRFSLQTF